MRIKDITKYLEQWAPISYQESYDNSGLLLGNPKDEVTGVLCTLDVTEVVIDEARRHGANLIVAHHPLIFKGLKKITGNHWVERCVIEAIRHNIAIYAIHTNLDNVVSGVNRKIAEKIGLTNLRILSPVRNLNKLVTFIPHDAVSTVLTALYEAGAGQIGNYDHCSYQIDGTGTFRPGPDANPHIGYRDQEESVQEKRVEVIFSAHLSDRILAALHKAHPYEEVAYYLSALNNMTQEAGSGMVGELASPLKTTAFLKDLKVRMNTACIRHTDICRADVRRVAICGGAGSFLLKNAIAANADVFITGDFKYHDFFEGDGKIVIADIGHYESEQYTKELLYDYLREKFTNIALRLSNVVTNPIKYL